MKQGSGMNADCGIGASVVVLEIILSPELASILLITYFCFRSVHTTSSGVSLPSSKVLLLIAKHHLRPYWRSVSMVLLPWQRRSWWWCYMQKPAKNARWAQHHSWWCCSPFRRRCHPGKSPSLMRICILVLYLCIISFRSPSFFRCSILIGQDPWSLARRLLINGQKMVKVAAPSRQQQSCCTVHGALR